MKMWIYRLFSRLTVPLTGLSAMEMERSDSAPGELTRVSVSTSTVRQRRPNWREWPGIFIDAFRSSRINQLERDLHEQRERALLLEGQLAATRSQIDYLREQADKAIENERVVYQTGINVDFQRKYGFAPFPNAPHIPVAQSAANESPVVGHHVSMRAAQEQESARFRDAWAKKFEVQS